MKILDYFREPYWPITLLWIVTAWAVIMLVTGCSTTSVTSPDGTVTTTRKPDAKTMQALRGAVETIGAAAAQQAIHEIAEQQNQR